MAKVLVYELENENLTGLGGPMGTERTWANWRLLFLTAELAKAAAEEHWKRVKPKPPDCAKLIWTKDRGKFHMYTQDLYSSQYHIRELPVEVGDRDGKSSIAIPLYRPLNKRGAAA